MRAFRTLAGMIGFAPLATLRRRRVAGLAAGFTLAAALLAGCSGDGVSTDCGLDGCVVTFKRGVEASASLLGVEARLVAVDGDTITVEIAGERVTLTHGQQQGAEVAGLSVTLESLTDSEVALRIGRN